MGHTLSSELNAKLELAKAQVVVGGMYAHYKDSAHVCRVVDLAFLEETEEVCVIYQEAGERTLTWIRPLSDFLATVSWKGRTMSRFTPVQNLA